MLENTEYKRPRWLKKGETIMKFDLFEKIIEYSKENTYTDFHEAHGFYTGYIIPNGMKLSYGPHPEGTIRISNHWSWYANIKKCSNREFIQCYLYNTQPNQRENNNCSSKPIKKVEIAVCHNGIYYPIEEA